MSESRFRQRVRRISPRGVIWGVIWLVSVIGFVTQAIQGHDAMSWLIVNLIALLGMNSEPTP